MDKCATVASRNSVALAAHLEARLAEMGFPIHPSSRVAQMCSAVRAPHLPDGQLLTEDDPRFNTALEGARDLQFLELGVDCISHLSPSGQHRLLLRDLTRDPVIPLAQDADSSGRDAQFHLLVAAGCVRAGMAPVTIGSSDVLCRTGSRPFVLEAKRIKALGRLEQRTKDAAKQIAKTALPGAVAVDISSALNPHNRRCHRIMPDSEFHDLYASRFDRFVDRITPILRHWLAPYATLGVVLHHHVIRAAPHSQWTVDLFTAFVELHPTLARRRAMWRDFESRYRGAFPTIRRPF